MNNKNSRIALQSREWIENALLDLLSRYHYDSITVSQICRKADLSRRTFYRLYKSKDSVLFGKCESLTSVCLSLLNTNTPLSYLDMASSYFDFWLTHKEFLLQLKNSQILSKVFQELQNRLPKLCSSLERSDQEICHSPYLCYINAFGFGGLNNMLIEWIHHDMEVEPKELMSALNSFIYSLSDRT